MKKISIYTDGACRGNPGPGGWGAVLIYQKHTKELYGFEPVTTNNRMELMAVIRALLALKEPCNIDLFTDSKYVKNGVTDWVKNWEINGWKNAARKEVKNRDLWERVIAQSERHIITWRWLKGHDGNEMNERADALARKGIKEFQNTQQKD